MREPVAKTVKSAPSVPLVPRAPRVFAPRPAKEPIAAISDAPDVALTGEPVAKPRPNWLVRLVLAAGGTLISLALGLWAEALIRDLFARYEWLGWTGLTVLGLFVFALLLLGLREGLALSRLRQLDRLRAKAVATLISDRGSEGRAVVGELSAVYATRADLARARNETASLVTDMLDGADMVRTAERHLMGPLDAKARALTAAAARRVTIVTALSPRALVDIAFVTFQSLRLARQIATLYGARPGLAGTWRLSAAILGHLAVTGGVALGDSLVQQLLGHGLAAKVSARLGEGFVNGVMTVRVGIAAIKVVRPLPFDALKQPMVVDYVSELAKIGTGDKKTFVTPARQ